MSRRRRRKKRTQAAAEPKSRFQPELRYALVSVLISLAAGLLLGNKEEFWFSLPVCYVWLTGIFITYCLYLIGSSRNVLPPDAEHGAGDEAEKGYVATREGARLLFIHAVRWLPAGLRKKLGHSFQPPPANVPESFGAYGAGIVPSHLALAIGRGLGVTRAAGPGYVRLDRGEHILKAIDLRLQYRRQPAQAVTRDGIPLNTFVSTLFRVRRPPGSDEITADGYPYPYSPETIYRLLYANSLDVEAEKPWSERLCPQVAAALVGEISQYSMDQLYQPAGAPLQEVTVAPIVQIRDEIAGQFQRDMHTIFEFDRDSENPLQVLSATFSELEPPPEVMQQRIESWRSEWKQRQRQHEAEAEKEALLTQQAARARAELDLIHELTEMINTIHLATGAELSEVIVMRLSEALDQLAGNGSPPATAATQKADSVAAAESSAVIKELTRHLKQYMSGDGEQGGGTRT